MIHVIGEKFQGEVLYVGSSDIIRRVVGVKNDFHGRRCWLSGECSPRSNIWSSIPLNKHSCKLVINNLDDLLPTSGQNRGATANSNAYKVVENNPICGHGLLV